MDILSDRDTWLRTMWDQIIQTAEGRLNRPLTNEEAAAVRNEITNPALFTLASSFADAAFDVEDICERLANMSTEFAFMVSEVRDLRGQLIVIGRGIRNDILLNSEFAFVLSAVDGSYIPGWGMTYVPKRPVSLKLTAIYAGRKSTDVILFGDGVGAELLGEEVETLRPLDILVSSNWSPLLTL